MRVYRYDQTDKEKAASKRGRNLRRKGHQLERDIVNELKQHFEGLEKIEVQRMLQSKGGGGLPDVEVRQNGFPLFHIECKKGKRTNIKRAMDQAIKDSHGGAWPVAITQDDYADRLITMRLEDWIGIIREWLGR